MPDIKTQLTRLGITGVAAKQAGYTALAGELRENEEILAAVAGDYDGKYGAAAATDQRVVFAGQSGGLFKKLSTNEYQYRHITSVDVDAGKVFSRIDVVVAGDRARIDKVPNDLARAFARAVREKVADAR